MAKRTASQEAAAKIMGMAPRNLRSRAKPEAWKADKGAIASYPINECVDDVMEAVPQVAGEVTSLLRTLSDVQGKTLEAISEIELRLGDVLRESDNPVSGQSPRDSSSCGLARTIDSMVDVQYATLERLSSILSRIEL